jgi:hypothetical protein
VSLDVDDVERDKAPLPCSCCCCIAVLEKSNFLKQRWMHACDCLP